MSVAFAMDAHSKSVLFAEVARRTDFLRVARTISPRVRLDAQKKLTLSLPGVDLHALHQCVIGVMKRHGTSGWQYIGGRSLVYGGLSLVSNPDHRDGVDQRFSSIGAPSHDRDNFSSAPTGDALARYGELRNSYFDTYAFRCRTEASREGVLGTLIDSIPLSPIRSRIAIIPGANTDLSNERDRREGGWHRDETVFQNLRVNIPLRTDPNFLFETEGVEPYHLPVGRGYTWDTNIPHRVYCRGATSTIRIHLVLGFAPWFSYDAATDSWEPNEFFGRLHPFDMIAEGHLGPHIRLVEDV